MEKSRRGGSGYTHAELLICAIVVLLVSFIAYPRVLQQLEVAPVERAARAVASDLRHAVELAERQGSPVRVELEAAAMAITLRDARSGEVLQRRALGPGTAFSVGSLAASGPVDVLPTREASGPLVITLGAPLSSARVRMTRAARVSVEAM
jgi:hypothetical protein